MSVIFPTLLGISYPVRKRTNFNNIVQQATSGIEVRIANWTYGLYEWTLPFDWLSSVAAQNDFQTLESFYEQVYASWAMFLYDDPTDDFTTAASALKSVNGTLTPGIGDGTTTTFQAARQNPNGYGGTGLVTVPIYNLKASPTPLVYLNGTLQVSGYTIGSSGLITFGSAPAGGVVVTATFGYYWPVRFLEMNTEWENLAYQLWNTKQLSLRQVRVSG